METRIYTQPQAYIQWQNLIVEGFDATAIQNVEDWALNRYDISKGDIVVFKSIEITLEIKMEPKYTCGFEGQLKEKVIGKVEKVLSEQIVTLKKSKGQLVWK